MTPSFKKITMPLGLIYYILLIGLGFLWTGTAYIIQAYRLFRYLDGDMVNILTCGIYYICQIVGIIIVSILYKKIPKIGSGRILPLISTIVAVICTFISVFTDILSFLITVGIFLNLAIGILSGSYLTRLATNVPRTKRGTVFGSAYAFGSIGTWILSMPMNGKFLWEPASAYAVITLAAISLILLKHLSPYQKPEQNIKYTLSGISNKTVWLAAIVLFLLTLESTLGFSFPLKDAADNVYIEFTRAFYSIGLLVAGIISDKSRRLGAICCLASLSFPFAALALGNNVTGEVVMWILAYLFLGFISTHRILVFSDISSNNNIPSLAVVGLIMGRLGDAFGTLCSVIFKGTSLVIFSTIVFVIVILFFFQLYQRLYFISYEERERQHISEYASRFLLSSREQDVLSLIIKGRSNSEIANELCITESTVKFHVGNIFKKTNLHNRQELITHYEFGKRI